MYRIIARIKIDIWPVILPPIYKGWQFHILPEIIFEIIPLYDIIVLRNNYNVFLSITQEEKCQLQKQSLKLEV